MLLMAAQMLVFFTHADQTAIPNETVNQLANKGIAAVSDLSEFNKESLKQILDNLRNPGGRIPNPDPGAPAGSVDAQEIRANIKIISRKRKQD
mmetsp:Transcript_33177/g.50752  ORF Transcript_33177/g.50752 Transcript_33177/m.50752 type:complete len:93 (+) Transcript_33177:65-343(+)